MAIPVRTLSCQGPAAIPEFIDYSSALGRILSTFSHGTPALGAWLVIGFETGIIVVPLLPPSVVVAAVVLAGGFHLACAIVMGLNSFLWIFPATYPCILAVSTEIPRLRG